MTVQEAKKILSSKELNPRTTEDGQEIILEAIADNWELLPEAVLIRAGEIAKENYHIIDTRENNNDNG